MRPIELAHAYAIFANGGKEVIPIAIRSVEDKNGTVFLNPEREVRQKQQAKGAAAQIISPQTAYVMTKLLENTVKSGTLAGPTGNGSKFTYRDAKGRKYTIPAAGKTGTTQNWADAWTACFTPYYTSIFWFGFDKPGQSLGLQLTGSTLAGYAMASFMEKAHEGLPYKDFTKPSNGTVDVTVCSVSGGLPTEECGSHTIRLTFLEGTQPTELCTVHSGNSTGRILGIYRLEQELYRAGFASDLLIKDDAPLSFDLEGTATTFTSAMSESYDFLQEDEFGNAPDYNYLLD